MASLFDLGAELRVYVLGRIDGQLDRVVAARTSRLGEDFSTVSSTSPGTPTTRLRRPPGSLDSARTRSARRHRPDLRMDPEALRLCASRTIGPPADPFLVVGSAGSTDTGTVDPLQSLARCCRRRALAPRRRRLWRLLPTHNAGPRRLSGIQHADSIAIDPHKGCPSLWRRRTAGPGRGAPHRRQPRTGRLPPRGRPRFWDQGHRLPRPELTRPFRAMQMWLPSISTGLPHSARHWTRPSTLRNTPTDA